MTLDVPTLLLLSTVVVVTSSGLFIAEAWARTGATVDRLWTIAFVSAITTAFAYLAAAVDADLWWANAIGNGASVLTVWAMWSGIRAYSARASLIGVSMGAAAFVTAAVLVAGPDGGPWAGGAAVLAGTATGAGAAGAGILRGPLRHFRSGAVLSVILLLAGGFYALRLVVFVAAGPESWVFGHYLGTEVTTIVTTVLVTSAAFVAVTLRTQHARDRASVTHDFDPLTGARTAASFARRARVRLDAVAADRGPVALLVITPEELRSLAVAFGQGAAEEALLTCGEVARVRLPSEGVIGRDGSSFLVLLPDHSPAHAASWATAVRKDLIDAPLTVAGRSVRVTASIGISAGTDDDYDLDAMRAAAETAAREALDRGGNRTVSAADVRRKP